MLCPSVNSLTDDELNQTYSGILPSTPFSNTDRDNGVLKPATVTTIVSNLKSSGVIPTLTKTNSDAFFQNQTKLINDIKTEYCFYYSRYTYSLKKLLKAIGDINQTNMDMYLTSAQSLNQKMKDLIQIVSEITTELKQTDVVGNLNTVMKESQSKLMEQNRILSSNDAATKLNKEMVKYTEEKGRYTDNLLKVYSVLNIVVLGLLVYVYKSAG